MFGALTKAEACENLVKAIIKNKKYRGQKTERAIGEAQAQCLAHWHKPRAKKMNPANRGCPKKTVVIKGARGAIRAKFTAHVCPKKGRRRRRSK